MKPRLPAFTALWRSTPTLWSGAQQYPQQAPSVLSSNGAGHSYSPHSILEHGGSRLLLPRLSFIESMTGSCLESFKLDPKDTVKRKLVTATAKDFIALVGSFRS